MLSKFFSICLITAFTFAALPAGASDIGKCPVDKGRIESKISAGQKCMTASDCTLIQPGCTLGCNVVLNKSSVQEVLKDAEIYRKTCDKKCEAVCEKQQKQLACEQGECVVVGGSSESAHDAMMKAAGLQKVKPSDAQRSTEDMMRDAGIIQGKTAKEAMAEMLNAGNARTKELGQEMMKPVAPPKPKSQ